jgi:hypothetical protein
MSEVVIYPEEDGSVTIRNRNNEVLQRIAPSHALSIASAIVGNHAVLALVREARDAG